MYKVEYNKPTAFNTIAGSYLQPIPADEPELIEADDFDIENNFVTFSKKESASDQVFPTLYVSVKAIPVSRIRSITKVK